MRRRSKVKISKWLEIPDLERYEEYICQWHYFCKSIQENAGDMEGEVLKNCNMYVLQNFFGAPYDKGDFYSQFEVRLEGAKATLGMA